jgi:hypothetical protein
VFRRLAAGRAEGDRIRHLRLAVPASLSRHASETNGRPARRRPRSTGFFRQERTR